MQENMHSIGLLAIDDTKDADTDEYANENKKKENKKIDKAVKNEFQVGNITETLIPESKLEALKKSIENNGISDLVVQAVLGSYDYKSLAEIKMKDYISIINDLKGAKN